MAFSSVLFGLLILNIISNGQALTRNFQSTTEKEDNPHPLVIAPIFLNNNLGTNESQAKNYSWTNSSEFLKEDLLKVIDNNSIKVEYKETNIIPKLSNRIVINPLTENSVYTSNNTIDKDKWSKEDDSLELLVVPNADNEFQSDDNHYHFENNTVPSKIVDYFLKPEKSKNSSIKLKEKIKEKNKSKVANNLLFVIPNNNKTNNNTTRNINIEQKKNESLVNGLSKIYLKDVTKGWTTQIITTVNTKTTPGLAVYKNTALFKVNNVNTNDSVPKRNIGKNLSNNLITIVTNKSLADKSKNIALKTVEKDDADGSSLLNIINKTLRLQAKITNTDSIRSSNNNSINNITNKDFSRDISTNNDIFHNVTSVTAQRQNFLVNNEVTEPGSNYVYTNMSGEEYSDLLETITTEGLSNRSDLRSVGKNDRKKVVNALKSTLNQETSNKNKTAQPLIIVIVINPK